MVDDHGLSCAGWEYHRLNARTALAYWVAAGEATAPTVKTACFQFIMAHYSTVKVLPAFSTLLATDLEFQGRVLGATCSLEEEKEGRRKRARRD